MCAILLTGAAAPARSHRHAATARPATLQRITVNSAKAAKEKSGGVEISLELSRPITPRFSRLTEPDRLIVDLYQTEPPEQHSPIDVNQGGVRTVRASQFRNRPPITRVVVDMESALAYDWHPAGNRVIVHLQTGKSSDAVDSSKSAKASPVAGVPATSQGISGSGGVAAGIPGGGSSLTAGSDTAVLQLARGGELRVCPGTTVAVTQGSNGLTLGLNAGAMEMHYRLSGGADVVMTPDFRFQLTGPGDFHVAISTDRKGNTCVRGLDGNNVPVAVTELLGDGAYLVRPREQIVFRSGSLAKVAFEVPAECGCPATAPQNLQAGGAPQGGVQLAGNSGSAAPKNAVDTPLVYRGDHAGETPAEATLAALPAITRRAPSGWSMLDLPTPELAPHASGKPAESPGLLSRVRHFFGSWFRSK